MLHGLTILLAVLALEGAAVGRPTPALALTGEAAETFLREARVLKLSEYESKGITRPRRATLSNGELTLMAAFKDVDEVYPRMTIGNGRVLVNLKDHYKHEVAAYELDKILGLGIVPPTVERKIWRQWGSLQMWVNGAMTEWERKKDGELSPPDMAAWNNQISTLKVFLQLIWDTDYNNISNIMVDESWHVWKIDSSRAFRVDAELRREAALTKFSRALLASLENLDQTEFERALTPWLNPRQINTMWQRRTRILELAEERVAEFGPESVLYD